MIQRRRVEELWRSRDFRALIFLGVLAALTLILAFAIRGILGPFLLAGILALILNPVVNAAERGGFSVRDLSITEPTLENVFIHLTGKELRD